MEFSFDPNLREIAFKVEDGERLTFNEGLSLYETTDLNALGKLADHVRRKKHGLTTYYNVNRHFNHTNICVADCKFCGFYRRARAEDAYTHSVEGALDIAREAVNEGATELHIVGGLNSKLPFEYYTDLFSSLKREFPKLHLKALTMVELDFMARFYKMSDEEVIEKLHAAGMDSCPGGGAEIFAEPTRSRICDHKCDGDRWLELAGKVHKAGLKTNATMLYGHIESTEDRIDHLVQLREQQDRSHGFQCFIPLAFYPPGTALSQLPGPDAIDNLKTIAVSRLMLDNFDHIKAYWVMLGKTTAQTALHFGANDLDGTITDGGELTHSYSVESGGEVKMTKQEIIEMIHRAGFEAVERDTVYNRVERLMSNLLCRITVLVSMALASCVVLSSTLHAQNRSIPSDLALEGLKGSVKRIDEETATVVTKNGVAKEVNRHRTRSMVFDKRGRITSEWIAIADLPPSQHEYDYDKEGKQLRRTSRESDDKSIQMSLKTYRFDGSKRILFVDEYRGDQVDPKTLRQMYEYYLDESDRISKHITKDSKSREIFKRVYSYDSQNIMNEERLSMAENPVGQIFAYENTPDAPRKLDKATIADDNS